MEHAASPSLAHQGTFALLPSQVRAMRLSFVGEMGWELHVPRADCVKVYRAVMQAGARHGIANAGYRAIDSLSIEKGPGSPLSTTLCFSSSTGTRARSFSSASGWVGVTGGAAGSQNAENSPFRLVLARAR